MAQALALAIYGMDGHGAGAPGLASIGTVGRVDIFDGSGASRIKLGE